MNSFFKTMLACVVAIIVAGALFVFVLVSLIGSVASMGSEDKGIYEANLRICSHKVRIPMTGVIESLNVSVAAGIMLYEAVRQRK